MIMVYNMFYNKQDDPLNFYQCGVEYCTPGHSNGPRIRYRTLIHIVLEGQGKIVIDNKVYFACAGQAFVIPSDINAYYEADLQNPWKYCWISFDGTEQENCIYSIWGKDTYVKSIFCGYSIKNSIENILKLFYKAPKETTIDKYGPKLHVYTITNQSEYYRCNGLLYEILGMLLNEVKEFTICDSKQYLDNIKNYIDTFYMEINTITQIAEYIHLHPNYINSIFKQKYNITLKKYLISLKINHANRLLKTTDYSIQYISELCGFNSLSSFGSMYKKHMGMSPRTYRSTPIDKNNCSENKREYEI